MFGDQFYWASRIRDLGIGTFATVATLTTEAATTALQKTLQPAIVAQARVVADRITADGAAIAARRLTGHHA
jgi:vancomycin aglycone glucosyltransferase